MFAVLGVIVQVMISDEKDCLSYSFTQKYGQVEVGGPFVGTEFHHSRPLPSRISFYYPVANSIDLSSDYWRRDESLPMTIGLALDNEQKYSIGREGWNYVVSPHRVTFLNEDSIFSYRITYEFCLNQPAMVVSIAIKNTLQRPLQVRAYTHLLLALRTCQTYARIDSAVVTKESGSRTMIAHFTDAETKSASVFVMNAGEMPVRSWADVVIECAGTIATAEEAIHLSRRGGTVEFFGVCPVGQTFPVEPHQVFFKELTIVGSYVNPLTFDRAIKTLANGIIRVDAFPVSKFSLDEVHEALRFQREGLTIKSIIEPNT